VGFYNKFYRIKETPERLDLVAGTPPGNRKADGTAVSTGRSDRERRGSRPWDPGAPGTSPGGRP